MRNQGVLSKVVYFVVALLLVASFATISCSPQATPSPTATSTQKPTPSATAAPKPTPTPTPSASGQPQYGGTLRIAQRIEADSLGYPAKVVNSYTTMENAPAVETLLRNDPAANQVPWLATAFNSDVGAKTITFTLRKGIKFQDGTDFNAQAVKWNLDQLIAAKTASASMFKSIDAVDDYTVRINLTAWDSTLMANFGSSAGSIVSPSAFQTNGLDWSQKHPIGTGPFKFVSWNLGATIPYTKSDGYWQKGRPYLDGVQFTIIADDVTREIALRAGEADVGTLLITTDFAKLKGDGFAIVTFPAGVGSLVPDSANPKSPFADVRVRQAAAYAIDNVTLIKPIYGEGGATVTNQLTYQGNYAYNPSVVGYPYSPDKAKQLLTAAGYPNGFQTRIMASGQIPLQATYATGVQGYLKAVGIDATLDVLSTAQVTDLQLSGKTWQGLGATKFYSNPDWISTQSTIFNGNGSYVSMLLPDDYSQAVNNGITAPDFQTKQKYAQQAMQLAVDKYCLMIPMYASLVSVTLWPNVHDTGLMETSSYAWAPENAWMVKR